MLELVKKCETAAGREKAPLVLKNARVVNVFTEELMQCDVAIVGDTIVGLGSYEGVREIDLKGKFIAPGFIDAHMHIESTMATPVELAKSIVKSGTTSLIADPHEIVNVCGSKAMTFLLEATEKSPVNIYFMLPSAVPATKFETNGANFTADEMAPFVSHPRVLGLGEVMCYNEVVACETEILKKLLLNRDQVADGHAPNMTGKDLQAYVCAGVETEHECITFDEALEKVRAGLKVLVREGSAAKNLKAIVEGLIKSDVPYENFMFCTDDKHLEDIKEEGHIIWNIKCAVKLGMDPIAAIKMASYNAAKTYGLKRIGAVAAGYRADLVVLDSLEDLEVNCVFKDGVLVDQQVLEGFKYEVEDEEILNTVRFKDITVEKLALKAADKNYVIGAVPYQILTTKLYEAVPQENGFFKPNQTYSKLCLIERHQHTGNVAVAPYKGFNIINGAIASSVAHDSHNVIAAGDNDHDIVMAVNHLKQIQGGFVIVREGVVVGELKLPVAGLMSTLSDEIIQHQVHDMMKIARDMGIPESIDPFITLSFMALPVIPEIRLTDLGLFDVESFEILTS